MEGQCLYLLVVLVVRSAPRVRAACRSGVTKNYLVHGSLHSSRPRGGVPGACTIIAKKKITDRNSLCLAPARPVAPSTTNPSTHMRATTSPGSMSGRDVVTTTGISFALVFATATSIVAQRSLMGGAGLASALSSGLQSGQRWGRVSAGFNGGRSLAQGQGANAIACTMAGAVAGGALGASAISQIPQRAALFCALAVTAEHAFPPALKRAKLAIDAEMNQRQELFARRPSMKPRSHKRVESKPSNPLVRVKQLVEELNGELGHMQR